MKRVIYLSLLLLVACSDTAEVAKETDLMLKEMEAAIAPLSAKEGKRDAQFWQNTYLKLDIALEKYKKADPEAIEFMKEARTLFEIMHDFVKDNELSVTNIFNTALYAVNTFTAGGTTLLEANKQASLQQKQLIEKAEKAKFHAEQLEAKMCAKYQIQCKANSPAAPEKK